MVVTKQLLVPFSAEDDQNLSFIRKIRYFEESWQPKSFWFPLTSIVGQKYCGSQMGLETV